MLDGGHVAFQNGTQQEAGPVLLVAGDEHLQHTGREGGTGEAGVPGGAVTGQQHFIVVVGTGKLLVHGAGQNGVQGHGGQQLTGQGGQTVDHLAFGIHGNELGVGAGQGKQGAAQGILMLLGIYVGAIYGGSISAVLLHTPGTPASAATAIEGYKLSQKGEAGRALGVATLGSYIGGVISVILLVTISPQLAKLALKFSSAEFFLLAVFGLCIIGSFAMKNSLFDVWVMLIAGVVGYFMSKAKVPTSPAILGLILGPMAEKNFRTALLKSGGDPTVFFSTVICWFFIILIVGTLFGGQLKAFAGKIFKKKAAK